MDVEEQNSCFDNQELSANEHNNSNLEFYTIC